MAGKKKRDALAGVNMAMSLDSQANKDLAKLKRMAKKPGKVKTKPINMQLASNSIQKPGAFNIKRNTIMKARFGGKVVQKMQGGGSPLSPVFPDWIFLIIVATPFKAAFGSFFLDTISFL